MTHIGKIGRLPQDIRNQLGQRIEDGLPGTEIVQWLNGHPDVQQVLKDQFGGRPITEQNLSEWKQTGHPELLRRQEARLAALELIEESDELESASDDRPMSDRLATVLSAELVRLAMTLLAQETDPEKRWQRLCAVHQVLSRLRRDDHRALQTRIKQEQWEQEVDAEFERARQAAKQAELFQSIKRDMGFDDLLKERASLKPGRAKAPRPPAQAKPNPAVAFAAAKLSEFRTQNAPDSARSSVGLAKEDLSSDLPRRSPAKPGASAKEELKESKLIQPNPTKSPSSQSGLSSGLPRRSPAEAGPGTPTSDL